MRALALLLGTQTPPPRRGSKLAAPIAGYFCAYVGSSWRSWLPSWRQHAATLLQNEPHNAILEPTWIKIMPKTPQQATPTPPEYHKTNDNQQFFFIFTIRPMCQSAPKIDAKSIKNQSKIDVEIRSQNWLLSGSIFPWFLMDMGSGVTWKTIKTHRRCSIFHGFAPSASRILPTHFWHRFCIDFSSIWAPTPKSLP